MPEREALRGEILDLFASAAGLFPGPALEALIAWLEGAR